MKKSIIVLLILVSGVFLSGCTKGELELDPEDNIDSKNENSEVDPADLQAGMPYLKMKIIDYPQSINDFCQSVAISFEAENIGDTPLYYSDLENKYLFEIKSDDAISGYDGSYSVGTVDTTYDSFNDDGLLTYEKLITDFGELAPGEKTIITYTSLNYTINDQHEYYWTNSFSSVANGSYNYYIEFGKLPEEGAFFSSEISKSSEVNITTSVYDANGGSSYCDYEIINDPSIDLYEL